MPYKPPAKVAPKPAPKPAPAPKPVAKTILPKGVYSDAVEEARRAAGITPTPTPATVATTPVQTNVVTPSSGSTIETKTILPPGLKTDAAQQAVDEAAGLIAELKELKAKPAVVADTPPPPKKVISDEVKDAYALLKATFATYGLDDPDFLKTIEGFMERGLGSQQAALELRETDAYKKRFYGNQLRRDANLNVLSEAEYLALENSYNETLRSYGLQGYFGTDRKVAQSEMAKAIGSDIAATEFKDRIDTVVTRVTNSDPNIKKNLKSLYNIGDEDLIRYFLNPKENLPRLKEKVTAAEISTEFAKYGLKSGLASAEEYAKLGIDKAKAAKGAETIASFLPEATKLGQIYKEEGINYTQGTAEEEVLKNLDEARRKRLKLTGKEIASFSGSSGVGQGALKSQSRGLL